MDFQQFLQDIGCELRAILWKDLPAASDVDRLELDLHRAEAALRRLRSSVDEAQNRLAEKERRARWLEDRVELYWHLADPANAWRYALELDGLRHAIYAERARLRRRYQAYQVQLGRVRQLRQRLDRSRRILRAWS
jgi:chromosome segregation ATPase